MTSPLIEQDNSMGEFKVHLVNFEGPFDLLLQLIAKHKLDITEISLSKVTDEFIAYVKAGERHWDLDKTSSFLLVAATLLDLKTARLLPSGEVEDTEDLAVLEARDLLFARLLQYRAFKEISKWISVRIEAAGKTYAHPGGIEEQFQAVLPKLKLNINIQDLAAIMESVLEPKPLPVVSVEHLHSSVVSVGEQANFIAERLRKHKNLSFRALTIDCDKLTTVVRFLSLLELFRNEQVVFEQAEPLAELNIRWIGSVQGEMNINDSYDSESELPIGE